jgi:hypothetical protein
LEHRASLVVGLVGFGFVAFVLISLARLINTHPDIDHLTPPPKPTSRSRPPVPASERRAAQHAADLEQSTKELLVDAAASRYTDRAREQVRRFHAGLGADVSCEPQAKRPARGGGVIPSDLPASEAEIWQATIRCRTPTTGFEVVFPVCLVRDGERWEIEAETRAILDSGDRPLKVSIRELTPDEFRFAQSPVLRRPTGSSAR